MRNVAKVANFSRNNFYIDLVTLAVNLSPSSKAKIVNFIDVEFHNGEINWNKDVRSRRFLRLLSLILPILNYSCFNSSNTMIWQPTVISYEIIVIYIYIYNRSGYTYVDNNLKKHSMHTSNSRFDLWWHRFVAVYSRWINDEQNIVALMPLEYIRFPVKYVPLKDSRKISPPFSLFSRKCKELLNIFIIALMKYLTYLA